MKTAYVKPCVQPLTIELESASCQVQPPPPHPCADGVNVLNLICVGGLPLPPPASCEADDINVLGLACVNVLTACTEGISLFGVACVDPAM